MGRLEGKVAIVTGSARGIGKAIAARFASEGALVAGVDVLADEGEQAAREIVAEGGAITFHHADISSEADVRRVVTAVLGEHGRVDVLVNNAGVQREAKLTEVTVEDFHAVVNVNLLGAVLLCREVLPGMVARGSGAIVNMSSVLGLVADPLLPVYGATKAGLLGLTRNIAITYGPDGIRCNAICPGDVDTELHRVYFGAHPAPVAFRGRVEAEYPLRRIASTDEIAKVAAFLASEDASFVSGGHIVVDGAILARIYEL